MYRVAARRRRPERAELVRIRTGQRSGGMAEVLEGLNLGDQVVTEGVQSVRPGQPVQVGAARERRRTAAAAAPRVGAAR